MQLTRHVIGAPRGSRCLNTCGKCYPHIFTAFCLVRWPMAWQNCDKNILAFLSFKLIQILVNWIRKILERHSLAIKTSLCVMLSSCTSNSRKKTSGTPMHKTIQNTNVFTKMWSEKETTHRKIWSKVHAGCWWLREHCTALYTASFDNIFNRLT